MPVPDPQPAQPRAIFPIRWVLLIVPSFLVISSPVLEQMVGIQYGTGVVHQGFLQEAVVLCFVLGFRLEKWLRGEIKSVVWALNYGFMIVLGNALIFIGVMIVFFSPPH